MPTCPVCKATDRQQAHMVQPVMYGGRNAVDYYNCEYCGVMYKPVGFEGEQAKLGIKPDKK